MLVTLEEMKGYLRVDYEDDDLIIESLINTAQSLILDIVYNNYQNGNKNIDKKIKNMVIYKRGEIYETSR